MGQHSVSLRFTPLVLVLCTWSCLVSGLPHTHTAHVQHAPVPGACRFFQHRGVHENQVLLCSGGRVTRCTIPTAQSKGWPRLRVEPPCWRPELLRWSYKCSGCPTLLLRSWTVRSTIQGTLSVQSVQVGSFGGILLGFNQLEGMLIQEARTPYSPRSGGLTRCTIIVFRDKMITQ